MLYLNNVSFIFLFSRNGKGWCSYHSWWRLLYFLLIYQLIRRAFLSCLYLYSFWTSLEHSLVIYLIVLVPISQSPDNVVSNVSFMLNLMKFVLNACSWAASIMPSVSFLRKPFLAASMTHQSQFLQFVSWTLPCRPFYFQLFFLFFTSPLLGVFTFCLLLK